jgi:hypothetical protein
VPDVVVASIGPPVTAFGFHSRDLRVLEWDPLAHRWGVGFDAQKVIPPDRYGSPSSSNSGPGYYIDATVAQDQTPLLDPKADVRLGPVRFGQLLPGRRRQLMFSASLFYGGSGLPAVLAVVDFKGGVANLVYAWTGQGLDRWTIADGRLRARASYWTPADAHCCPLREYSFVVSQRKGSLVETGDDRAWLGVIVHEVDGSAGPTGPLQITELSDPSPASGHLRVGDILLNVLNAPAPRKSSDPTAASSIFDKLSMLHAGQMAKFLISRGGVRVVVSVPLGSLKDAFGEPLTANDYSAEAL